MGLIEKKVAEQCAEILEKRAMDLFDLAKSYPQLQEYGTNIDIANDSGHELARMAEIIRREFNHV